MTDEIKKSRPFDFLENDSLPNKKSKTDVISDTSSETADDRESKLQKIADAYKIIIEVII